MTDPLDCLWIAAIGRICAWGARDGAPPIVDDATSALMDDGPATVRARFRSRGRVLAESLGDDLLVPDALIGVAHAYLLQRAAWLESARLRVAKSRTDRTVTLPPRGKTSRSAWRTYPATGRHDDGTRWAGSPDIRLSGAPGLDSAPSPDNFREARIHDAISRAITRDRARARHAETRAPKRPRRAPGAYVGGGTYVAGRSRHPNRKRKRR